MRMPTRLGNGEGRVSGEAIDTGTRLDPPGYGARHVGKVMRVIGGDPSRLGLAAPPSHRRRVGREAERAVRPLRRVMLAEERALTSGALWTEPRIGDWR